MLAGFLELKHMLVFVDGLDEAAGNRCYIEECIDRTSRDNTIGLMVSTREYAFESSLVCHRLSAFCPIKIQNLDHNQQARLIEKRLPSTSVSDFCIRLERVAAQNPEMASSPLLLCLLIEEYKRKGSIPTRRHDIYESLVQGLLLSHLEKYGEQHMSIRRSTRVQQNSFSDPADFLQALAFACHMRLHQRDFQWVSPAIKTEMQAIYKNATSAELQATWKNATSDSSMESMGQCLLDPVNTVGLLSRVGDGHFRFSHLTLQEYLAAKCILRTYNDAQQLLDQLMPLHSRWTREVARFVASMLPAKTFMSFCKLVLDSEDGSGAQCEMVRDFLKEFGPFKKVEQMVHNKLLEIRGANSQIAGLCHPSQELRNRVLSEMKKFGVPSDPFAQPDGIVAQLKRIAENCESKWYTRAAAIVSVVQIAQMDHCQKGSGRDDMLQWVLEMLVSSAEEDTHFVLVKGLGTCLNRVGHDEADYMMLASEDEQLVLGCLNHTTYHGTERSVRRLFEALADLKVYSEGLMDWVLGKSFIEKGQWPLRHVLLLCKKAVAFPDNCRATRLCRQLLGRVHAASIQAFQNEQDDLLKGLSIIFAIIGRNGPSAVLHFLQYGQARQHARMLCIAADFNIQFERPAVEDLARSLLSQDFFGVAGRFTDQSLLAHYLEHEYALYQSQLENTSSGYASRAFCYLQTVMEPAASDGGAPRQVAAKLKDFGIKVERRKRKQNHAQEHAQKRALSKVDTVCVRPAQTLLHESWSELKNESKQKVEKESEQTTWQKPIQTLEQESEYLSLATLATAVRAFTPSFKTSQRDAKNVLNLYCASRLWETSGLIQPNDLVKRLSLSDVQSEVASEKFGDFLTCKQPWIKGSSNHIGSWEQAVTNVMKDQTLGRLFFDIVLVHVQESFQTSPDTAMEKLKQLKDTIEQWQPSNAGEQLEQHFLLKELLIGCSSQEPQTWTGLVSSADCYQYDAYLSPNDAKSRDTRLHTAAGQKHQEKMEGCGDEKEAGNTSVSAAFVLGVVESIRTTSDAGVQEHACWALGSLAADGANRAHIVEAGGIDQVVMAMSSLPAAAGVQEQACWVLLNLAANNTAIQAQIAKVGGIKHMVTAMLAHRAAAGCRNRRARHF